MSQFLTQELCNREWNDVMLDLIANLSGHGIIKRHAGTIVVIDPDSHSYNNGAGTMLFTADVDSNAEQAKVYRSIAQHKAAQSCRTGLSGRELANRPHFYRRPLNGRPSEADTKYMGGIIYQGLVVAFSGVEAHYDEFIATTFAALLVADYHGMYAHIDEDQPLVMSD